MPKNTGNPSIKQLWDGVYTAAVTTATEKENPSVSGDF